MHSCRLSRPSCEDPRLLSCPWAAGKVVHVERDRRGDGGKNKSCLFLNCAPLYTSSLDHALLSSHIHGTYHTFTLSAHTVQAVLSIAALNTKASAMKPTLDPSLWSFFPLPLPAPLVLPSDPWPTFIPLYSDKLVVLALIAQGKQKPYKHDPPDSNH